MGKVILIILLIAVLAFFAWMLNYNDEEHSQVGWFHNMFNQNF